MPAPRRSTAKRAVWAAADRHFLLPTDLTAHLEQDPTATFARLATSPERFGRPRPSLDRYRRNKAHAHVRQAPVTFVRDGMSQTEAKNCAGSGR